MRIAITGGIGSGKSTVANIVREKGYPVFSCDEIYGELLKDSRFLVGLAQNFGPRILTDGKLNRKALAEIVFGDKEALKRLDDLVHPEIMKEALRRTEGLALSFCEVPLLFENGFEKLFDDVVVVLRAKDARLQSIMLRDHITQKDADSRINSQYNYDLNEFTKYYVIHNDTNLDDLRLKTEQILTKILNKLS